MALALEDRNFLKRIHKRLGDNPLPPGSDFYEPIYEHLGGEAPVALMRRNIEFCDTESIQRFSGFRGSGKTTELFRLKKSLEESGYVVLYGDALKYLNPAQEIDISDLLIVLAGTRHPAGWDTLRSLVYRRFDAPDFQKFFGGTGSESPLADELIDVCGGHFRDLLLLLRETILRTQTLPVTREVIHSAIAAIRSNFMPIAIDDAKWLYQIGQLRDTVLPTTGEKDVNRLTRFLDTHFVLYFLNGKEWYDIHPLIRDEVSDIVKRLADRTPTSP